MYELNDFHRFFFFLEEKVSFLKTVFNTSWRSGADLLCSGQRTCVAEEKFSVAASALKEPSENTAGLYFLMGAGKLVWFIHESCVSFNKVECSHAFNHIFSTDLYLCLKRKLRHESLHNIEGLKRKLPHESLHNIEGLKRKLRHEISTI